MDLLNLANKSILIVDRGLYSYMAEFMALYYGKVFYHNPTSHSYPKASIAMIGQGLKGVEWVEHIEDAIDQVDVVFFPDCMDGRQQTFLREKGYNVCGSGSGEKMELDKVYFLDKLREVGIPVAHTFRAEGLDEVWEYVKDRGTCYMKCADKYRSDWETTKHMNRFQTEIFLNRKRELMGVKRANEIEVLIQDPIDSECEAGIDGFMLNGQIPKHIACGYEIKDKGIVEHIIPEIPPIIKSITDKLAPVYKELGYQGPYSNEVRITKNGKGYPIDETCRCGSPPTSVLTRMYGKAYAEAVWSLAHGELPNLSGYEHEYGAEIILSSKWHCENELYIPHSDEWLVLKNHYRTKDGAYCVPNDNDGIFGSVIAIGKTIQEAIDTAMKRIKSLDIFGLEYDPSLFDKAAEVIACGEKHGIPF